MKNVIRLTAVILVFPAVYFFLYWTSAGILYALTGGSIDIQILHWTTLILSLGAAGVASVFTWRKVPARILPSMGATVLLWALLIGSVGFIGGFFGPILLGGGNQGPLLGIFITGPLGLILGAFTGLIVWFIHGRKYVMRASHNQNSPP